MLQVLEKEPEEEDGFQIGRDKLMACILSVSRTGSAMQCCTTWPQRNEAQQAERRRAALQSKASPIL